MPKYVPNAAGNFARRPRLSATGAAVRNAICLIYMEDLHAAGRTYGDLLGYLDSLHIKAVCSPVHDKDKFTSIDVQDWCERHIDPETGDLDYQYVDRAPYVGKPKKPHVHIGICLKGKKTAKQFTEMMGGLMVIRPSMWEKMEDYEGFTRYLAHLDSPQKQPYSALDIVGFGGADLSCLLKEDKAEHISDMQRVHNLIAENKITWFHQLADAAFESGDLRLKSAVIGGASFWASYMSSKGAERKFEYQKKHGKI